MSVQLNRTLCPSKHGLNLTVLHYLAKARLINHHLHSNAQSALIFQSEFCTWVFGGGAESCFEVNLQVEQVRLGIPKEQPLAVQQWEGLIAVNYPARAAGIVRHERMSDALKKVLLIFILPLQLDFPLGVGPYDFPLVVLNTRSLWCILEGCV
jgi:hypothetical protein